MSPQSIATCAGDSKALKVMQKTEDEPLFWLKRSRVGIGLALVLVFFALSHLRNILEGVTLA